MANPFSNDVTVNLFQWGCFTSRVAVSLFQWGRFSDITNLFIIILNSKAFSKYTDIYSQSFRDVPALL